MVQSMAPTKVQQRLLLRFERGTYMMNGGPVPDEILHKSRRSHPEAGGVAKPALEMRNEVGFRGVDHENLNRSLPRLTGVSAPLQRRGWLGKSISTGSRPQKTKRKL